MKSANILVVKFLSTAAAFSVVGTKLFPIAEFYSSNLMGSLSSYKLSQNKKCYNESALYGEGLY
jgi:hypothetical protein